MFSVYQEFRMSPEMESLINRNNMAAYEAQQRYQERMERILLDNILSFLCGPYGRITNLHDELIRIYNEMFGGENV